MYTTFNYVNNAIFQSVSTYSQKVDVPFSWNGPYNNTGVTQLYRASEKSFTLRIPAATFTAGVGGPLLFRINNPFSTTGNFFRTQVIFSTSANQYTFLGRAVLQPTGSAPGQVLVTLNLLYNNLFYSFSPGDNYSFLEFHIFCDFFNS